MGWSGVEWSGVEQEWSGVALRILFLPWIIWAGMMLFLAFALFGPAQTGPDEYFVIGLWFFVGIANNLFWGLRAMNDLKAKFRQLAARAAGA